MIDRDITLITVRAVEALPLVREVGTLTHIFTNNPEALYEVEDHQLLAGVFYVVEQQYDGTIMRSSGPFSEQSAQLLLKGTPPASFPCIAGDVVRLHLAQAELFSSEQKALGRQTAAAFLAHLHVNALFRDCPVPLVTPNGSTATILPLRTNPIIRPHFSTIRQSNKDDHTDTKLLA